MIFKIYFQFENQKESLEKELKSLSDIKVKKGKAAAVFNMRDRILGEKKSGGSNDQRSQNGKRCHQSC